MDVSRSLFSGAPAVQVNPTTFENLGDSSQPLFDPILDQFTIFFKNIQSQGKDSTPFLKKMIEKVNEQASIAKSQAKSKFTLNLDHLSIEEVGQLTVLIQTCSQKPWEMFCFIMKESFGTWKEDRESKCEKIFKVALPELHDVEELQKLFKSHLWIFLCKELSIKQSKALIAHWRTSQHECGFYKNLFDLIDNAKSDEFLIKLLAKMNIDMEILLAENSKTSGCNQRRPRLCAVYVMQILASPDNETKNEKIEEIIGQLNQREQPGDQDEYRLFASFLVQHCLVKDLQNLLICFLKITNAPRLKKAILSHLEN